MPSIIGDRPLLRAFSCLEPFPSAVLAVSGGPDSTALMHLARHWLSRTGRGPEPCAVVTVDHGLRAESRDEAAFVAEQARRLEFSHATIEWAGEKPKTGIQSAARHARYDLLTAWARTHGMACIVTAHTEDDQAETLLMRLRRGSGVDGLAAMSAVSDWNSVAVVRPLLRFSKGRLLAYLRASSIPFLKDPSNENLAFERVRLRRSMKALASAGIRRPSLAMAASRLGRSRDALVKITDHFLARNFRVKHLAEGTISRKALDALPEDIALRAIARILALIGGDQEAPRLARVERALSLLHAAKPELTLGGCIVISAGETLNFYREPGRLKAAAMPFQPGASCVWDGRFRLTFAATGDAGLTVRQLGADGWLIYRNAMKERCLPVEANRLAALTTPALWKENRLISAPTLKFFDRELGAASTKPVEAALAPSLARFSAGLPGDAASVLGKDTPIPYL